MVVLKNVLMSDYRFLYELLEERENKVNISHTQLPTYEEHVSFWSRRPYNLAYMIYENTFPEENQRVGYIYLTHNNEIGIFIKKEHQKKEIGDQAIVQFFEKHDNGEIEYIANINPDNNESKEFFSKYDFKLIQHTYKRDKTKK